MEKVSKNDPNFSTTLSTMLPTTRRGLLKGGAALSGVALAASAVHLPVAAANGSSATQSNASANNVTASEEKLVWSACTVN